MAHFLKGWFFWWTDYKVFLKDGFFGGRFQKLFKGLYGGWLKKINGLFGRQIVILF